LRIFSIENFFIVRINAKDNHQDKLNELKEMIAVAKLEKMTIVEEQVIKKIKFFVKFFN
jgi:predicted nucleic acid-binding OB-fold protein